jgi:signal peptidase
MRWIDHRESVPAPITAVGDLLEGHLRSLLDRFSRTDPLKQPAGVSHRKTVGPWWAVLVTLWAIMIYAITRLLMAGRPLPRIYPYILQPLLWASLAAVAWVGWRHGLVPRPRPKPLLLYFSLLIAALQVAAAIGIGLIEGFGRSPYSHAFPTMLGNMLSLAAALLALELSRAYLMALLGRHFPLYALLVTAALFAVIEIPPASLFRLQHAEEAFRLTGQTLLPTLSQNLFASLLVFLGGPLASLLYRGTLAAFEWSFPVLPNLSWFPGGVLGTVTPGLGLIFIYTQFFPRPAAPVEFDRPRDQNAAWALVGALSILILGFNAGLFGVQPTLISSGSMQPTFSVGDVVVTRRVPAESIRIGDVIRYRSGAASVVHRVVEVDANGGQIVFLTRGDANSHDDLPVSERALQGKVIFTIPKVGWLSIAIRRVLAWMLE